MFTYQTWYNKLWCASFRMMNFLSPHWDQWVCGCSTFQRVFSTLYRIRHKITGVASWKNWSQWQHLHWHHYGNSFFVTLCKHVVKSFEKLEGHYQGKTMVQSCRPFMDGPISFHFLFCIFSTFNFLSKGYRIKPLIFYLTNPVLSDW